MRTLILLLVAVLMLGSGYGGIAAQDEEGVATITGVVTITNPIFFATTSEPYIMLTDMTPYVERDRDMPVPLRSQILAPLEGDLAEGASFALHLPIAPQGTVNDLDRGTSEETGVQIYSVEFSTNNLGDPFQSPVELTGWGTALSSLVVELGTDEVIGGQVVVWAPDANQLVSTGLGPDGRFLTDDDPVGSIPAGWTVLDLTTDPFKQIRAEETEVTIVEGDDGFTDYSHLSFTEAFDTLLAQLELRYAFTELKGLDWNALRAEYRPRVERAEASNDLDAFKAAMFEFSLAFGDGHVSSEPPEDYITDRIGGRLGMRLAETETGEVIVISVTEGLPADLAGIELGAIVSTWDGRPTGEAVNDEPLLISASTDISRRVQRFEFLTRGPLGERVEITFQNPDEDAETTELTFAEDIEDRDAMTNRSINLGSLDPAELPIDSHMLPNGIGYIRVDTFFADSILMSTAWDYALNNLNNLEAVGLIIDVRDNGGGEGLSALYLAGSFYDREFELFRSEIIDGQGRSIDTGSRQVVPSPAQWDLPVAVLIDNECASACEIFVAAMAENPDHLIVGYTPTAGVEGGVYFWNLPGDVPFQATLVRPVRDGRVFLEGAGVPPNVEVPATEENLLDPGDAVLGTAVRALVPLIVASLQAEEEATPDILPPDLATPVD